MPKSFRSHSSLNKSSFGVCLIPSPQMVGGGRVHPLLSIWQDPSQDNDPVDPGSWESQSSPPKFVKSHSSNSPLVLGDWIDPSPQYVGIVQPVESIKHPAVQVRDPTEPGS